MAGGGGAGGGVEGGGCEGVTSLASGHGVERGQVTNSSVRSGGAHNLQLLVLVTMVDQSQRTRQQPLHINTNSPPPLHSTHPLQCG
jgi:hypothetical protein